MEQKPILKLFGLSFILLLLLGLVFAVINTQGLTEEKDFRFDQTLLNVQLQNGSPFESMVLVENIKDVSLSLEAEILHVEEIVSVDPRVFSLNVGETRPVEFSFFASEEGVYLGRADFLSGTSVESLPIIVEIESEDVTFDVQTTLSAYTPLLHPGDTALFSVSVYNLGSPEPRNVQLTFELLDFLGRSYYYGEGALSFSDQSVVSRSVALPPSLQEGYYVFVVTGTVDDTVATSTYLLQVEKQGISDSFSKVCEISSTFCALGVLIFVLFAFFVLILLYFGLSKIPLERKRSVLDYLFFLLIFIAFFVLVLYLIFAGGVSSLYSYLLAVPFFVYWALLFLILLGVFYVFARVLFKRVQKEIPVFSFRKLRALFTMVEERLDRARKRALERKRKREELRMRTLKEKKKEEIQRRKVEEKRRDEEWKRRKEILQLELERKKIEEKNKLSEERRRHAETLRVGEERRQEFEERRKLAEKKRRERILRVQKILSRFSFRRVKEVFVSFRETLRRVRKRALERRKRIEELQMGELKRKKSVEARQEREQRKSREEEQRKREQALRIEQLDRMRKEEERKRNVEERKKDFEKKRQAFFLRLRKTLLVFSFQRIQGVVLHSFEGPFKNVQRKLQELRKKRNALLKQRERERSQKEREEQRKKEEKHKEREEAFRSEQLEKARKKEERRQKIKEQKNVIDKKFREHFLRFRKLLSSFSFQKIRARFIFLVRKKRSLQNKFKLERKKGNLLQSPELKKKGIDQGFLKGVKNYLLKITRFFKLQFSSPRSSVALENVMLRSRRIFIKKKKIELVSPSEKLLPAKILDGPVPLNFEIPENFSERMDALYQKGKKMIDAGNLSLAEIVFEEFKSLTLHAPPELQSQAQALLKSFWGDLEMLRLKKVREYLDFSNKKTKTP